MNYVFSDKIFVTLLVYLYDLLVFVHSVQEHLTRMEVVLGLLQKHGFKLKPSKCYILVPQIKYLGFVFAKALRDWHILCTVREVRLFVVFCSFYRRFVAVLPWWLLHYML